MDWYFSDTAPEEGATLATLMKLRERGAVRPDERIVLFNTGNGLKYPLAPEQDAGRGAVPLQRAGPKGPASRASTKM